MSCRRPSTRAALAVALALLAESFGRDVWWLWRRRHAADRGVAADRGRGPRAAVLTALALLVVWVALVAPNQPSLLTPGAFVRLPIEGIVVIALALVLPGTGRHIMAWVVGPALGLLVIVKLLDLGFFTAFDRPFNPVDDWSYTSIGIETLRASIGRTDANLALAGGALLLVAALVLPTLAVLRLTRVAARHRRHSIRAVGDARRRLGALLGVRRGARLRGTRRLRERRGPGRPGGARGAGRPAGRRAVRTPDPPRPLSRHAGRPAADRPARQGRPARVRRELREGRGPGILLLAAGRRGSRLGDGAAASRRLLVPERLAHLADLRRHELAGALHAPVGDMGQ